MSWRGFWVSMWAATFLAAYTARIVGDTDEAYSVSAAVLWLVFAGLAAYWREVHKRARRA